MKVLFSIFLFSFILNVVGQNNVIFVEAESFQEKGGWLVDQQAMDQMGSPFLLAHGLGIPVKDAETKLKVEETNDYYVWVRTRDWVATWKAKGTPGRFQLLVNNKKLETDFGTEGAEWNWQKGGKVKLLKGENTIGLHDLTGFEGRCDAIVFAKDANFVPPNNGEKLAKFRSIQLNLPKNPLDGGSYDFVVVGGGMAGCCAAVSAARQGLKVALIHNRPVLGGNNSSEVRVGLSGLIIQNAYPELGKLVNEIGPTGYWNLFEAKQNPEMESSKKILAEIAKHPEKEEHNAGPASNYEDEKKQLIIDGEENISLFLNMHVFNAETKKGNIVSVTAKNINTGIEYLVKGEVFADCTGDGNLGYLAGADFRVGRESKKETGEIRAPEKADNMVMGTSVQWNSVEEETTSEFPECPWAIQFDDSTCHKLTKGDWNWETGFNRDQIEDIEVIKDHAYRVVYGNWDYLKNKSQFKEEFANRRLSWVAHIGGKRESRRLLGDIILKEQDILNQTKYPDACITTTWEIDLHYPIENELGVEPYLSRADTKKIEPYEIPYRCLYSRNINNLFMAGRNISVTHVALGTVRVMRTTGMMGEVVGMAAAICIQEDCTPREVYLKNMEVLKAFMVSGVPEAKLK